MGANCLRIFKLFQSTPLREGRRSVVVPTYDSRWFQSTPLREGRLRRRRHDGKHHRFNPRPCERGDADSSTNAAALAVSIHAPARGATVNRSAFSSVFWFQSTPLREGRPRRYALLCPMSSFNPRPCERGDAHLMQVPRPVFVSIHAPARGATRAMTELWSTRMFQSTPLREGRRDLITAAMHIPMFQSTPLREGRPDRRFAVVDNHAGFNPRPCERGDREDSLLCCCNNCFNPRPCERGDMSCTVWLPVWSVFQSTPLREGRPRMLCHDHGQSGFNPRPCERGDSCQCGGFRTFRVSIHAPARGATPAGVG
ncbi:hypothetical protein SAMN05421830_10922 [Desulfomicrobium norvegicum]|uniref:Uncharacterized protein n=1 Tax=Desulfomicrobium norvegicum (strain DSM 1741 / NCIMB 8310) TaxID=52561 RepID=A0A8G2C434_DESNO|nr:hypothetical protein SAMN05421830_10922 [Desulfomicrobium norvegicum]